MKDRISPRRRRALLFATVPMALGLAFVASPDAKADDTCGYVSVQVANVGSTTVPLTTTCAPPCTGGLQPVFIGPGSAGDGDPAGVAWYLCITP